MHCRLTPGSLSSKPAGTLTIPVASMNFGAGEPHLLQKLR
jgi:hypothetical protein